MVLHGHLNMFTVTESMFKKVGRVYIDVEEEVLFI